MIPGSANPLLLASAASAASYNIERSLRFNSADSAYLSRTPSVAGNRKTWTWAGWVKRSEISAYQVPVSAGISGSTPRTYLRFDNTDAIRLQNDGGFLYVTSSVYRDPAAWLHLVWVVDTTNATTADRVKLYVNGVRVTAFSTTTTAAPNEDTLFNSTSHAAYIGVENRLTYYFSGYLADIHFIDGQALDPTSFGEFDTNGVWQPKAYTGSYPSNSFHLDFADNSAATTAGIGKDVSGNGNDWTPVNLSVAAGASNDSLVDTPTNYGTDTGGAGGEVRGNYCTLNPLVGSAASKASLSNGNMTFTNAAANTYYAAGGTLGMGSGKWYWEITCSVLGSSRYAVLGIADSVYDYSDSIDNGVANTVTYYSLDGSRYIGTSRTTGYGSSYATSDVIMFAFDADTGKFFFGKNGTWTSSGDPATGTNPAATVAAGIWFPVARLYTYTTVPVIDCNFGQRPFAYTAPSGFKALCTTNLPELQTITTSGSYTGNGVADGPFVYLNGVPIAMTVNGNAVTFGTEADKLSSGFKVRTTSTAYNQNAATYNYSITSTGDPFKVARAQSNP